MTTGIAGGFPPAIVGQGGNPLKGGIKLKYFSNHFILLNV